MIHVYIGKVVIFYINCSTVVVNGNASSNNSMHIAQLVCGLQQFLKSKTGFTHGDNIKSLSK